MQFSKKKMMLNEIPIATRNQVYLIHIISHDEENQILPPHWLIPWWWFFDSPVIFLTNAGFWLAETVKWNNCNLFSLERFPDPLISSSLPRAERDNMVLRSTQWPERIPHNYSPSNNLIFVFCSKILQSYTRSLYET